jgi:carbamoyltransferase
MTGGLRRMWTPAFTELIGGPPRAPGAELTEWHADLARSAQEVLERVCLAKARALAAAAVPPNLCMAGGVALNCVMTAALRETGMFSDIFVQPAAGDAGGALGAAAQVAAGSGDGLPVRRLEHVYLGQGFSDQDIVQMLRSCTVPFTDYRSCFSQLADDIAGRLARGQVIGWFQGRAEFGPRALGNRSILADPQVPDMRDRVNERIKMREKFRPFAPAVLATAASDYFRCPVPLPFMLETVQVHTEALPSVTHVDGSARVQTVDECANPRFAGLLSRFGQLTGCPVLLNTSFNQRGEPIVNSPADALACFVRSRLDALVLDDFVVDSRDVPRSWRARQAVPGAGEAGRGRLDDREVGVYELV